MNKTEAEYAKQLELQKQQGEILDWRFEPLTFRLAHRCTYTPDFLVVTPDEIQIHEVKGGFIREDAAVKWKTAAARHPHFRWFLAQKKRKTWNVEEYRG